MFCFRPVLAHVRSKSALLLAMIASVSSLAFCQESFMSHFTPSGGGAGLVNCGDFNNDGIPDVITGNNGGTSGYGVWGNLGINNGRFHNPINSAPGVGTFDMALGDFNGDGKPDVALAGYGNSTEMLIQVMLGNGDGSFRKGQTINLASGINGNGITAGDFNGDGKLDLALVSNTT